jgi:hypothetical protein
MRELTNSASIVQVTWMEEAKTGVNRLVRPFDTQLEKKQHFPGKQEQQSAQKPMERDKKAAVQVERPTMAEGAGGVNARRKGSSDQATQELNTLWRQEINRRIFSD